MAAKQIPLIGCAPGIDLLSFVCLGQCDAPFLNAVRNTGVIFDTQLALKQQMNKLCKLACLSEDLADRFSPTVSFH